MKIFLSFIFLTFIFSVSSAQVTFSHSVGLSYYLASNLNCSGITYSPRINFLEFGDEATLSAGTHLGLGFSFLNPVDDGIIIAYDIPIVAEINLGHGAHIDTRLPIGFFAGLGFGFNKIASTDTYSTYRNKAFGAVFNFGLRTKIGCIRLSYLKNTIKNNFDVLGIEVFYTIGDPIL